METKAPRGRSRGNALTSLDLNMKLAKRSAKVKKNPNYFESVKRMQTTPIEFSRAEIQNVAPINFQTMESGYELSPCEQKCRAKCKRGGKKGKKTRKRRRKRRTKKRKSIKRRRKRRR